MFSFKEEDHTQGDGIESYIIIDNFFKMTCQKEAEISNTSIFHTTIKWRNAFKESEIYPLSSARHGISSQVILTTIPALIGKNGK